MRIFLKPASIFQDKQGKIISSLLLFLFFSLPFFILRLAIACYLIFHLFDSNQTIKKEFIFKSLFLFYCFAYIYSPYWNVFSTPAFKVIGLIVLAGFGVFWAKHASSDVNLPYRLHDGLFLSVLAALIYLVNYKPLGADIPWRGDEGYHINSVIVLSKYIALFFDSIIRLIIEAPLPAFIFAFCIALSVIVIGRLNISSSRKMIGYVYVSLIILVSCIDLNSPFLKLITAKAKRYPLVERWFSLLFTYPYKYGDVALYRGGPFIAVILLGWFLFYKFNYFTKNRLVCLFLAFSFVTIPLVYFYSTFLYLELPIMLLMVICLFDMKSLVKSDYLNLIKRPSWLCLLIVPFLKETVLVFIFALLTARMIYHIKISRREIKQAVKEEFKVTVLVAAPLIMYIFFRLKFSGYRQYGMNFSNLIDLSNYLIFFKALFVQTGPFMIIGIGGLFSLFKKDRISAVMCVLLFLCSMIFFMGEDVYIGYSRWNLFLLPVLFVGAYYFITSLPLRFWGLVAASVVAANISLSPIHASGIRFPNWGSPGVDTAEYIYPYDQAIKWLSQRPNVKSMILLGQYHPYYGINYYLTKYDFNPEIEEIPFGKERFNAEKEKQLLGQFFKEYDSLKGVEFYDQSQIDRKKRILSADTALYHSVNNIELDPSMQYGGKFKIVKKISNSEHSLYILRQGAR
ncbi:MAG: hypothetical protein ABH872_04300 [Candidatus Omnitrophota bacterium]